MSRYEGRLEPQDLGPGVWTLVTTERRYVLRGTIPKELSGKRVTVEADPEESFGFEMSGPALRVRSISGG